MSSHPTPSTAIHTDNLPHRITVLGVGQMGLVCAGLLAGEKRPGGSETPLSVRMWGHSATEVAEVARHRQTLRLPGFRLDSKVEVTAEIAPALEGAQLIVCAIPVQFIRETLTRLAPHIPAGARIVSVSKGIENDTLMRPTEIFRDCVSGVGAVGVLSGPTIAAELARELPAVMVAASGDAQLAADVQKLFSAKWMRIYTKHDVVGVELAGAMKNVIAIAAGLIDGLEAGNNVKSALLARGLAEITRLGAAMGADPETFFGVAGVGDLATTCFSPEGRNRTLGEALGRGGRLETVLAGSSSVVEGVATTKSVVGLAARLGVELPIIQSVNAVLFEGLEPRQAISRLMAREQRAERVG